MVFRKTIKKMFSRDTAKTRKGVVGNSKISVRQLKKQDKKIFSCPPNISPEACVRELSKRKKARVVSDINDLSDVEMILTSDHGQLTIPSAWQSKMALLDIGNQRVWAVALEDFYLDNFFLSQIARAKDLGYEIKRKTKITVSCLDALVDRFGIVSNTISKSTEEADSEKSQAIYFFEEMINGAVEANASDVHICIRHNQKIPTGSILYRVHGLVHKISTYPADKLETMLSVAYANTLITDKLSRSRESFSPRENQSCTMRVSLSSENKHGDIDGLDTIELRYQHLSVRDGFDAIIRLLRVGDDSDSFTLEELGYSPSQEKMLSLASKKTTGAIFISGVTGSGKTTTLKTLLTMNQTQNNKKKTYTIEDPPEFKLYGISQISVQRSNDKAEISPFAAAMKDVMRADPDRIMVGEVRDNDSAGMLQAMVQSGHQVFATVHTSSALGIISRLSAKEIGLTLATLTADRFLSLLVYQRLLPVSCPDCKLPAKDKLPDYMSEFLKSIEIDIDNVYVRNERGCKKCGNRGTIGQTVCAEVIELSNDLLKLLRRGEDMEAFEFWRKTRRSKFNDIDSKGKTALEHALYKISIGLLDPVDVEEAFEPFEQYEFVPVTLENKGITKNTVGLTVV